MNHPIAIGSILFTVKLDVSTKLHDFARRASVWIQLLSNRVFSLSLSPRPLHPVLGVQLCLHPLLPGRVRRLRHRPRRLRPEAGQGEEIKEPTQKAKAAMSTKNKFTTAIPNAQVKQQQQQKSRKAAKICTKRI